MRELWQAIQIVFWFVAYILAALVWIVICTLAFLRGKPLKDKDLDDFQ